ncbi:MAG: RNA-binding S4 domain-containing protein [Candidatus Odyssella sp.]|nr:RNA-binding S4 domain-containing protein [Candidatus Odyssella sp.]
MTRPVPAPPGDVAPEPALRLDKWLWHARFFKSRSLAAAFCAEGRLRLNRRHIDRASAPVRAGDVLTFPLGNAIRVVRVLALGQRRGPPAEARTLYQDLTGAAESAAVAPL